MPVTGTLGARLYTSATALESIDLETIEDIDSLAINIEVGLIESFEDFGRMYEMVKFQPVDGRTYKLKGGYDEGTIAFTLAQDLSDEGQAILKLHAEEINQNTYPFKIVFSGVAEEFEAVYFGAKVLSFRTQMGSVGNVIRAFVNLR